MHYLLKLLLSLLLGALAVSAVVQMRLSAREMRGPFARADIEGSKDAIGPPRGTWAPAASATAQATAGYHLTYQRSLSLTFPAWTDPDSQMQYTPRISRAWLADVTGDRRADIVATVDPFAEGMRIVVFAGQGGGQFGAPVETRTQIALRADEAVVIGDVAGTGTPELVFVRDGVHVAQFRADGTAQVMRHAVPPTVAREAEALALADVDGDARGDLVVVGRSVQQAGSFQLDLLRNAGAGGFVGTGAVSFGMSLGAVLDSAALATGDFNGDGRTDIAAAWATTDHHSPGYWSPAFDARIELIGLDATGRPSLQASLGGWAARHQASSLASGDFNADGRDDLAAIVTVNDRLQLARFQQRPGAAGLDPAPVLQDISAMLPPHLEMQALQALDMDGDLRVDVAATLGEYQMTPQIGHAVQTMQGVPWSTGPTLRTGTRPVTAASGHADADTCADRIVPTPSGIDLYMGSGCTAAAPPPMSAPHPPGVMPGG